MLLLVSYKKDGEGRMYEEKGYEDGIVRASRFSVRTSEASTLGKKVQELGALSCI